LGNIYSAVLCEQWAQEHQAKLLLRIEDIDFTRCKPEFSQQMIDDLAWMGIAFDEAVIFQSHRTDLYQQALHTLINMNVLYPCVCTRKQIANQTSHPNPSQLDNYPRNCLGLSKQQQQDLIAKKTTFSWRLNCEKVETLLGDGLFWLDKYEQKQYFKPLLDIGDVIIGRKDITYSYHLAVVVDDALQHISHIIRGEDLRSSTPLHRVLQLLLGYVSPLYQHHDLLLDDAGLRMSKTQHSETLKALRSQGFSNTYIREIIQTKR